MTNSSDIYDVIIAGGGFAGLTLALALGGRAASPPLNVAVIEAKELKQHMSPDFDGRASALAPASRNMLSALGLWAGLAPHAQPITNMVITDSALNDAPRPSLLRFGAPESDARPLAHMIENRLLYSVLADAVGPVKGIEVLAPARFAALDTHKDVVTVALQDGRSIAGRLLVAADGRDSAVREAAGLKTVGWSYPQAGIVATVAHEMPHHGTAEEHFLPAGPFAILPLTNNRSSLVWTEARDVAQALVDGDDETFMFELGRRFNQHLGAARLDGPRWCYPLTLHLARDYVAARVALIGDAAHVVHPIAGLGLNLGLRDVAALAEIILNAVRLGLDFGNAQHLAQYQSWRRFDNAAVGLMCDALNTLFSNDIAAVRLVREFGLGLVNNIAPIKQFFASEATGHDGDVPKLLRGEPI